MNLPRYILLPLLATTLAHGQAAPLGNTSDLPNLPEPLVRSVYTQVLARHPLGTPEGEDKKIFAPYLSKGLLHRFDLADACFEDWIRQHPEPHLKPDFGWFEDGLFTGGSERANPRSFEIERTESEKDGSFQVVVRLTWEEPPDKEIWRVAVVVVQENGRLVVDNVIFLKDKDLAVEYRLSESLTHGCKGSHWVGYGEQRSSRKPPQK
jgi:hypothetical protein